MSQSVGCYPAANILFPQLCCFSDRLKNEIQVQVQYIAQSEVSHA